MINFLQKNIAFAVLLSCLFSGLLHQKFMNLDIQGNHLWRQSTTMWNIRNFTRHDANILNPRIASFNKGDNLNRYEFPIMQWSIAMIQKVTGEHMLLVRLLMFLFSSIGVIGFYRLMLLLTKEKIVAWLSASLFQFSPIIFQYAINPLPDVLALSCSIWYLFWILKYDNNRKLKYLIYSSVFLTLASLVKLPFLLFASTSVVLFFKDVIKKRKLVKSHGVFVIIQLIALLPMVAWYAWVIPQWSGNPVTKSVFSGEANWEEIQGYLIYHAEIMFPKRLLHVPLWPFFILGIFQFVRSKTNKAWFFSFIAATFLFFILEIHAITHVHDYYMFPFIPWLFIFIGFGIQFIYHLSKKWLVYILTAFVIFMGFYIQNITEGTWELSNSQIDMEIFNNQEELKNVIPRDTKVIMLNDVSQVMLPYILDKQGNVFSDDDLPITFIHDMIKRQGFEYMYSNSEKLNSQKEFQVYIDTLLYSAGKMNVYKLKLPK